MSFKVSANPTGPVPSKVFSTWRISSSSPSPKVNVLAVVNLSALATVAPLKLTPTVPISITLPLLSTFTCGTLLLSPNEELISSGNVSIVFKVAWASTSLSPLKSTSHEMSFVALIVLEFDKESAVATFARLKSIAVLVTPVTLPLASRSIDINLFSPP